MAYGIANQTGVPSRSSTAVVIETAWESGVRFFDTAQAYGASEGFLGEALRALRVTNQACVISKLHPALCPTDSGAVLRSVEESARRLGGPLWALLLHRADWLGAWEQGLGDALGEAKRRGLVRYLGASVYTVEEVRSALAHSALEVVQVPANAWDQRMLREGVFQLVAEQGKLCFVRSIFLQGLLSLPPETVAARLPYARGASERWEVLVRRFAVSREALAVRCALALPVPIVVGMETADQVRSNAGLFELQPLSGAELDEVHAVMSGVLTERILNPSRWQEAA